MAIKGNSAKDSKYLARIKAAIETDSSHPRHHGVKMQAHHLISAEGMRRSTLGKKIEKHGYDINLLPNLVFLPCTLQGACHLGVQLHRGNHNATIDQNDYSDDLEPKDYHETVSEMLKDLDLPLRKECSGDKEGVGKTIVSKVDGLSRKILKLIEKKPAEAPLTSIALKLALLKIPFSCGGVDSIPEFKIGNSCPVDHDHLTENKNLKKVSCGAGQSPENITLKITKKYVLEVGR